MVDNRKIKCCCLLPLPPKNHDALTKKTGIRTIDFGYRFWTFLLGFFMGFCLSATEPVMFHHLSISEGLSSNEITCFAEAPDGFFWIGTKQGLNRYDGTRCKYYELGVQGIADVKDILISRPGRMWVGTLHGLYYYESSKDHFVKVPSKRYFSSALKLFDGGGGEKGSLWVGTPAGVYRMESDSFVPLSTDASHPLRHDVITSFLRDYDGSVYIGTKKHGLYRLHLESRQVVQLYPKTFIKTLCFLSPDTLLIGTDGKGLLCYSTKSGRVVPLSSNKDFLKLRHYAIQDITKDRGKNFWIATEGLGVLHATYEATERDWQIQYYRRNLENNEYSIADNTINAIQKDNQGNVWFGSPWRGISILVNEMTYSPISFTPIHFRKVPSILSILPTKKGVLLGTDGHGLMFYDHQSQQLHKDKGFVLPTDWKYIEVIRQTSGGGILLGTYLNGLGLFTMTSKDTSFNGNFSPVNDVRDIVEDSLGNFWVATWGDGLMYFSRDKLLNRFTSNDTQPYSLPSNNVISLHQEPNGDLWLSTLGGGVGLLRSNSNRFKRFTSQAGNPHTLSSNQTLALFRDSRGYLWISTWGKGLNRLDIKSHKIEQFTDYLPFDGHTVVSILEDNHGRIWFGSKKGILMYRYETNMFYSFPELAGTYHINAAAKDASGRLYFGRVDGLASFKSTAMAERHHPPLKITGVKLLNMPLEGSVEGALKETFSKEGVLLLKHDQNTITFEFSVLKYPFARDYNYFVKLDGVDETWRNMGTLSRTTFTNLSSGEYVFYVRAKHPFDEPERLQEASLRLVIQPPFWQSSKAYLLYVFLFSSLAYIIFSWLRTRNKLKVEEVLHQKDEELYKTKIDFLTMIAHEFRTPLTLILSAIKRLSASHNDSSRTQLVKSIQQYGEHTLHLTEELLNIRQLEEKGVQLRICREEFVGFLHRIFLSFSPLSEEKEINYQWVCPHERVMIWCDKEHLEKAFYNLLFNAFKFTNRGGTIKVSLTVSDTMISISVQNSGSVIPSEDLPNIFQRFYKSSYTGYKSSKGFGLGLSIAKDVVKLHRGDIHVTSDEKQGTIFTILLPLANESGIQEVPVIKQSLPQHEVHERVSEDKNIMILVVEDHIDMQRYVQSILSPYYQVEVASNGLEGWEKACHLLPDLIISDLMMPELDGIGLTERLRTFSETSHIPILILTANTSTEGQFSGFRAGIDAYVSKPFDEPLLLVRVKQLIANRRLLQEQVRKDTLGVRSSPQQTSLDGEFIDSLVLLVKEHLSDDAFSVDFVAQQLGMSYSVVYKKVKTLTGLTPLEFITNYRLDRAAELLKTKRLTVSEVCYDVGFSSPKYFTKLFKKKFGLAPSRYVIPKEHQNALHK